MRGASRRVPLSGKVRRLRMDSSWRRRSSKVKRSAHEACLGGVAPRRRGQAARGRRRRTLFADAVLTYLREEDGRLALDQRFLELDRATLTVDRLVAELARYAELHRAKGLGGEAIWKERYPRFPKVHCVLAGAPRSALERRRKSVLALLHSHPHLAGARGPRISICLLEDLRSEGPFAPIFREVREPERAVNWLGSPAGGQTGTR